MKFRNIDYSTKLKHYRRRSKYFPQAVNVTDLWINWKLLKILFHPMLFEISIGFIVSKLVRWRFIVSEEQTSLPSSSLSLPIKVAFNQVQLEMDYKHQEAPSLSWLHFQSEKVILNRLASSFLEYYHIRQMWWGHVIMMNTPGSWKTYRFSFRGPSIRKSNSFNHRAREWKLLARLEWGRGNQFEYHWLWDRLEKIENEGVR